MAHQTQADGGRTENKRFTADDDFDASDLIVGDRIDKRAVANQVAHIGEAQWADGAQTKLGKATQTDSMDDVHNAILVDGETGVMVRASRHDSQSAWNQKEADWKVRAVGTKIEIEGADITYGSLDDEPEDIDAYAQEWANVVLQDAAAGYDDYHDIITVNGSTIALKDNRPVKIAGSHEIVSDD